MRPEQASEYAIERGGASFAICPVCDEHFPNDTSDTIPLAAPGNYPDTYSLIKAVGRGFENQLRAHCDSHTAIEYLTAIAERDTEIRRLKDPTIA